MKIAMIGHKRIPSREGGIEIVVEQLAIQMVKQGHEVHVYNRKGTHVSGSEYETSSQRKKVYKNIKIHTIPTFSNSKLNAFIYSILATLHAVFCRYDVIHYHAEGPCSMLWIPALFKIHTVATIHGLDWQRSKWGNFASRFLLFGEKMAVKYADEIIVLSKNMQNYFEEKYKRKTHYIPNGVSKPNIKSANIITKKYQICKNDYILFLARIVPEKGVHYLLSAYKKLNTTKKLVIAGGSSNTEAYYKRIVNLAQQDSRVIMTGFVQGRELEELYSNAYIYVLPSDVEGMPISLLEAMSYGNCCLVSNIPENIEISPKKLVSFQKGNVSDLTLQLDRLLQSSDEVESKKISMREYVSKHYSWETVTNKIINLYERLQIK